MPVAVTHRTGRARISAMHPSKLYSEIPTRSSAEGIRDLAYLIAGVPSNFLAPDALRPAAFVRLSACYTAPRSTTGERARDALLYQRSLVKALVTGGAGFIGSHLCGELVRMGIETVVLDDLSRGLASNVPDGARLVLGCVKDADAVAAVLDGVEVVFHLAARVNTRESQLAFLEDADTNIMGTLNVLAASRDAGVSKVIYSSSAAVYRDDPEDGAVTEESETAPMAPYGISKLAGEMYVETMCSRFGIDYSVLRLFNAYGPRQMPGPYSGVITAFVESILAGRPPVIFGNGEQVRDMINVGDIVKANLLAMQAPSVNAVLNIGTGIPHSINSIARIILESMGSDLEPVHADAPSSEIRYSVADVSKAREMLGFSAQATLESRIDEVICWMKDSDPGVRPVG